MLGLGQASAPPPFFLNRPIRSQRPRLHTPSGLCNRSTVDPWVQSMALGRPVHAHSGGPSQPPHATWSPVGQRCGQPRAAGDFALEPPCFKQINPRSIPVQKYFFLILFSFVLNLVLLNNSARGPDPLKIQF